MIFPVFPADFLRMADQCLNARGKNVSFPETAAVRFGFKKAMDSIGYFFRTRL